MSILRQGKLDDTRLHLIIAQMLCIVLQVADLRNMKRKDWIKEFERNGWCFKREGGDHTVCTNGKDIEPISSGKMKFPMK